MPSLFADDPNFNPADERVDVIIEGKPYTFDFDSIDWKIKLEPRQDPSTVNYSVKFPVVLNQVFNTITID